MITIDTPTVTALVTALVVFVPLYVWTAIALSAVFRKSGQEPWQAWVPVLNQIVLLRLGEYSGWLYLLVLIPVAGPVVLWAVLVAACHRISVLFGHGAGLTVVAALLLPLWASILGFGSARWLGEPAAADDSADEPGVRRTPMLYDIEFAPRVAPSEYRPLLPQWFESELEPESESESESEPAAAGEPAAAVAPAADEATDEPAAAAGPISAVPQRTAPDPEPQQPMVTRLPAAAASAREAELWAPVRAPQREDDAFPELSAQVSAVAGAADAGSPRSAHVAVAAQHRQAQEMPDDVSDETIITRRRRIPWSLIPPTGAPVPIIADVVILGRKPVRDPDHPRAQLIGIDDGTVSKTHARLERRDDHWFVTDLGSTNGVLFATMMGTEVEATPGVEIEAGERFYLGDAEVRLVRSDR